MSTLELYSKGARIWIPHQEKVWQGAELLEDYTASKTSLRVKTEEDEEKVLTLKSEKDLPFLRNPQFLIGENDLTSLSYLHEPAVLYNLKVRFCQHKDIYTYCGIVLVAINPYDELPIYDNDTIQTYRGQQMGDLDPHIFAIAEEAYMKLEREQRDQSIIVSGESGAGKTVSAKYVMRYLATVGGSATETQIERKVLASSPIMEAIGNAKTTRNDNSSRFGKFIELQFSKQFHISGASMRTYLLEKSRVVFQAAEERNYHIFYQLCAARKQYPELHLDHQNTFHYLNQGNSPEVQGIDDLKEFSETINALNLLGFTKEEQEDIFKILAAILHLGNVQFKECTIKTENEQDQEGCAIPPNNKSMQLFSQLLGLDEDEMRMWLCTRKIISMREVFYKPMSSEEAAFSRDALAKHIYAHLFNFIVLIINKALESSIRKHRFIGVLDIYGFETFEINSFEQFCINYANEKLQQQFNMHVFKLEQEEYIKEGIEWKMIDFYDNQPCIDLIETKLGILDLLDEECRMPRGSDSSWTEKLYAKCTKYSHFAKSRFGTSSFIIQHFADKVQYESSGFLEKNRDTVMEEQINLVKQSQNKLVSRLFGTEEKQPNTKLKVISAKPTIKTNKSHQKTVGSQFRDSLNMLMSTLNETTPHYVRCIKPNDTKSAFEYNPKRAVQQLRACGVLETIRISSAGFPSRWSYLDFFHRYRVLCKFKDICKNDMKKTCEHIVKLHISNPEMYQFGKTKIFFRAVQVAYLEKIRAEKLKRCCIIMQKTVRCFLWRKKYLKIKKAATLLQKYGRGMLARRLAVTIRRDRAARTIQRYVRGWVKWIQYSRLKRCIVGIQAHSRGYLARIRFLKMKYNAKAVIIQKNVRGWLARREQVRRMRKIVVCQAAIRRFLARKLYKKLKIEARSIEHVKKLNKGLENKIISLQQRIDELAKANNEMKNYQNEAKELKAKLTTFRALEIEIKNLNNLLIEKNKNLNKLQEEIVREKEEKIDLINEHDRYKEETEKERELWNRQIEDLRKEIDNMQELAKANEVGAEENFKVRLEEEKTLILNEQDSDRVAYQKLLEEYHDLEQHCEELEKQLSSQQNGFYKRDKSDSSLMIPDSLSNDFQDHGYGSVRSVSSAREKLENIDWKTDVSSATPSSASTDTIPVSSSNDRDELKVDVSILLKLQHKLGEVERERDRIQKRLDEIDMSPRMEKAENAARDAVRISELELINSALREQMIDLQDGVNQGAGTAKIVEQLQAAQKELERKSEEIIQLKSLLADQTESMRSLVNSKSRTGEYINEDGELALAYETQKTINKQLELELQDEKAKFKKYENEYKLEIKKLLEDNEHQQRLLSANLNESQNPNESYLRYEIARITTENLTLHEKVDVLETEIRKLKKYVKNLSKKVKEAGFDLDDILNHGANELVSMGVKHNRQIPAIKKKDRKYLGMFSYPSGQENNIMKQLVIELKPRTAVPLLPGLPAYIIFMMIRHTDYINDEEKVISLLSSFLNSVKKVIRKKDDDIETIILWLSNTLRLLHNMKQYSGNKAFQQHNTPKQNEQCLRNFDLSQYRQLLSDIAVWIYQKLIKCLECKIQPQIVPAILEHEEINIATGSKPSGMLKRTNSVTTPGSEEKPTTALLLQLTNHYKILKFYGVDSEVITQIFKQVFYFICASSLNNLLLRKELCNWTKGFQMRHNLSHFEMWTREKGLDEDAIQEAIQPIIQAAYLLQARKTEEYVKSICEMCKSLTPLQICRILNLYTPVDEYEMRVPDSFIKLVQAELQQRNEGPEQQSQLMDLKFNYPVRFPFNPSTVCLEEIEIPEVLKLPMLEKI